MTDLEPHRVELTLRPAGENAPPHTFVVTLCDLSLTGVEVGFTRLFAEMSIDDRGTTLADVVDLFTTRRGLRHAEALAFGRLLYRRLLRPSEDLRRLWDEIDADRKRTGRPLHFVVVLPAHADAPQEHEALWTVADLPFELLADDRGFLFQRSGNVLVRTFHGLTRRTPSIPQGGKATLVWANPQILGADGTLAALPGDVFTRHEAILAEVAPSLGLELVAPCDRASRRRLDEHLRTHVPVHLVSIVAHGADAGGAMLLHDEQGGQVADGHAPVLAQQLATMLRAGGVDVALLWTCYGARRHRHVGSLAEVLLHPDGGDVPVVVASHAALDAAATVDMARTLFNALAGAAQRDFERALSETWQRALGEDDLQWAAPVYYARPEPARPARIEAAMAAADQRAAPEPEIVLIDEPENNLHADTLRAIRSVFSPPAFDHRQIFSTRSTRAVALEHAPPLTEHFRGRPAEMNRGVALLAERRLVSIHGMPGIGKTTLSLAIAGHTLAQGNFDRAVWYALDGARTADVLAARLAQDAQAQDMDAAAIARAMGHNSWLVVLDNAEDLIDADHTGMLRFLDTLLREHAGVRFLLTTRHRLGDLPAAREGLLRVSQLEPPHALALFKATAGERLTPEARDSAEVRELVALLDGHPQSIVLVASQVDLFSLATIRHRIERDDVAAVVAPELIGEQDTGDGATAQRARRLLASLDLSYLPLAERHPAAAEMFAWLGALPVGLPAVLAPRVFGEHADECIAMLLQYNLVEQRGPDRRLSMPAPLRWYAARQLVTLAEERQRAFLASTTHALAAWVSAMHSQVRTPASRQAFDRAVAEQPNLVALMERVAVTAEPAIALAWSLPAARWSHVMQLAGRISTAIAVVAQACAIQPPGTEGEAIVLRALGDLYARTSRLKKAEQSYAHALQVFQTIKHRLGEADVLRALGDLYVRTSRLKEAEQSYAHALPLFRTFEHRLGEANTLMGLGDLYARTDRLKEAEQSYAEALPLFQTIEHRLGEANVRKALGDLYLRTDQLKGAEQSYAQALPLFQTIEARLGEANVRKALGDLYVRTARLKEAEQSYAQALPLFQAIEAQLGEANTLRALGDLYARTARLKEAEQSYAQALPLFQAIDARLGEANVRKALGDLYVRTDRLKEAEESYGEALLLFQTLEVRLGEANALLALADLHVRTARFEEAEQRYGEALSLFRIIAHRLGEANTLQGMGNLALAQGKLGQAFVHYREALVLHNTIENALGVVAAHDYLGQVARVAGALERAIALSARAWEIVQVIDDRAGERLALDNMGRALEELGNATGAVAAAVLAWKLSCSLGEPDARARGELLAQIFEGLDAASTPPGELVEHASRLLPEAIQACRDALAARGEDPLGPLPGIEEDLRHEQ